MAASQMIGSNPIWEIILLSLLIITVRVVPMPHNVCNGMVHFIFLLLLTAVCRSTSSCIVEYSWSISFVEKLNPHYLLCWFHAILFQDILLGLAKR